MTGGRNRWRVIAFRPDRLVRIPLRVGLACSGHFQNPEEITMNIRVSTLLAPLLSALGLSPAPDTDPAARVTMDLDVARLSPDGQPMPDDQGSSQNQGPGPGPQDGPLPSPSWAWGTQSPAAPDRANLTETADPIPPDAPAGTLPGGTTRTWTWPDNTDGTGPINCVSARYNSAGGMESLSYRRKPAAV